MMTAMIDAGSYWSSVSDLAAQSCPLQSLKQNSSRKVQPYSSRILVEFKFESDNLLLGQTRALAPTCSLWSPSC